MESKEFGLWFETQFGRDPAPGASLVKLQERVRSLRAALAMAEKELSEKEKWESKRYAAWLAWLARAGAEQSEVGREK